MSMLLFQMYVKKEDVRDVVNIKRNVRAILFLSMSAVLGVMSFIVSPQLMELYADFAVNPPALTLFFLTVLPVVAVILLLVGLFIMFSKPDYSKVENRAKKYKPGEMIKVSELLDNKFEWKSISLMILLLVAVVVLFYSMINPIYSLTSQM